MKHIVDKISDNFNQRMKGLECALERHKNWSILERVLNLRSQSCFELFGVGNNTIENVEYLFGLLSNCFLDDATMCIKTVKDYNYEFNRFSYGSDDFRGITELEMGEVLSLIEKYDECYDENDRFIDDKSRYYFSLVQAVKAKVEELKEKQKY